MMSSEAACFDQTSTSFNACCLETFLPIPDSDDDGRVATFLLPLVIGCYQLEEKTFTASTTEDADSADDASLVGLSSSRQGELRLYMIPSPASSLPLSSLHENNDATRGQNYNYGTLRFKDSACYVNMESGVLDGKWRRRRRCNTQRISTHGSYYETIPIFASACASGKIHLHSLEKKHNSSWTLLHLASSEDEHSIHGRCLCIQEDVVSVFELNRSMGVSDFIFLGGKKKRTLLISACSPLTAIALFHKTALH